MGEDKGKVCESIWGKGLAEEVGSMNVAQAYPRTGHGRREGINGERTRAWCGVEEGELEENGGEGLGGRGDNALNPKLAESSKGGLEGRGGKRVCRGETGLGDDPMSTRRDIDVRKGKGGEGGGHLVAEEGVGRVRGEGEKKPNRF
jgi:hypothetical protein